MVRFPLLTGLFVAVALLVAAPGNACSRADTLFYETFLDASCLQLPLTNTTLDAQGGLRLTTNGAPSTSAWDSDTDFDSGITYQSILFPPVGVRTLTRSGTGAGATLGLPMTLLPLSARPLPPRSTVTASTIRRWPRSARRTSCGTRARPKTADDRRSSALPPPTA
jgi:hypothetical protein